MEDVCEICGAKGDVETYSYRVVCAEGTINLDAKYCTECCDEITETHKREEQLNNE